MGDELRVVAVRDELPPVGAEVMGAIYFPGYTSYAVSWRRMEREGLGWRVTEGDGAHYYPDGGDRDQIVTHYIALPQIAPEEIARVRATLGERAAASKGGGE